MKRRNHADGLYVCGGHRAPCQKNIFVVVSKLILDTVAEILCRQKKKPHKAQKVLLFIPSGGFFFSPSLSLRHYRFLSSRSRFSRTLFIHLYSFPFSSKFFPTRLNPPLSLFLSLSLAINTIPKYLIYLQTYNQPSTVDILIVNTSLLLENHIPQTHPIYAVSLSLLSFLFFPFLFTNNVNP